MRLGWRNPRPNDFTQPNDRALKDLFGNLQRFMTWPHVTLRRTTALPLPTAVDTAIPWTIESSDEYQMHDANSAAIRAPQDFDTWMAVGVAFLETDSTGGAGRRLLGWTVNGAYAPHRQGAHFTGTGTHNPRLVCPIMRPVQGGDVVSVFARNDAPAAEDATEMEVTLAFLPLA